MYDVYLGPGTFAGTPYAADEVAKFIVNELKLKEGQTISKDQIIEYLGKYGLGSLWATDVAMVLRNMFGLTPTFFESIGGFGALLEELNGIVSQESQELDLNEHDIAFAADIAFQEAFNNAKTDEDEAVIASLSLESIESLAEIAELADLLSVAELNEVITAYSVGGDSLVEDWYEITFRPHVARYMESSRLANLAEAIGYSHDDLLERVRTQAKQQRRQMANREQHMRARIQARAANPNADVSTLKKRTVNNLTRNMAAQDRPDPLAQRAAAARDTPNGQSRNLAYQHHMDKSAAGMQASFKGGTSAQGERNYVNKQMQRGQKRMGAATPLPLPQHTPAQPHPIKRALSAVGRVAGRVAGGLAAGAGKLLGRGHGQTSPDSGFAASAHDGAGLPPGHDQEAGNICRLLLAECQSIVI